jgi:phospholipase D1/2
MSENAISNVKKAANLIVKPAAIAKQRNTVLTGDADGDESERQDFDVDGLRTAGFASSVMPTLEERTLFERRPSASHANGKPLFDALDDGEGAGPSDIKEARMSKEEKADLADRPIDASKDKSGTRHAPKIAGPANEQDKFGVPANANEDDTAVPNKDIERDEETEQEKLAVKARTTLRKHLNAKVGVSPVSTHPN